MPRRRRKQEDDSLRKLKVQYRGLEKMVELLAGQLVPRRDKATNTNNTNTNTNNINMNIPSVERELNVVSKRYNVLQKQEERVVRALQRTRAAPDRMRQTHERHLLRIRTQMRNSKEIQRKLQQFLDAAISFAPPPQDPEPSISRGSMEPRRF